MNDCLLVFYFLLLVPSLAAGQSDQALYLDGQGSYLTIADDDSLDYNGNLTVSAWVLPVCSQNTAIVGKQWCRDYGYYLGLRQQRLFWSYNDEAFCSSPNAVISTNLETVDRGWYHIAVVHNDTSITVYKNGEEVSIELFEGSEKPIRNTGQPLVIGAYYFLDRTYGSYFAGLIDDVRVWQTSLSAETIRRDRQSDVPVVEEGLVLNLSMDNHPLGAAVSVTNDLPGGSNLVARRGNGGSPQIVPVDYLSAQKYDRLATTNGCASPLTKLVGRVFKDENEDGVRQSGELALANLGVTITTASSSATVFTNSIGVFEQQLLPGTQYVVTIKPSPCFGGTNEAYTVRVQDQLQRPIVQDFAVRPTGTEPSVNVTVAAAPARCGFTVPHWVTVTNDGCQPAEAILELRLDTLTIFRTASSDVKVQMDTLRWMTDRLEPGQQVTLYLELEMPGEDHEGDTLHLSASVAAGAEFTSRDTFNYVATLSCAIDPNDKLTYPSRLEPSQSNYTEFTEPITYTIRFQNTGTDTAFTVRLVDTLATLLDAASFTPIGASHPYRVILNTDRELEVHFEDILLPDSTTDETASHGFFSFRISPRSGVAESDVIENRAGIYFDFNRPIITNTVVNTLVETLDADKDGYNFYVDCDDNDPAVYPNATEIAGNGIDEDCSGADLTTSILDPSANGISLFPNPTRGLLYLITPGSSTSDWRYRIYDLSGRRLLSGDLLAQQPISLNGLLPGVYVLSVYDYAHRVMLRERVVVQ